MTLDTSEEPRPILSFLSRKLIETIIQFRNSSNFQFWLTLLSQIILFFKTIFFYLFISHNCLCVWCELPSLIMFYVHVLSTRYSIYKHHKKEVPESPTSFSLNSNCPMLRSRRKSISGSYELSCITCSLNCRHRLFVSAPKKKTEKNPSE